MSKFQIIITGVFIFFIVVGILVFSGAIPLGNNTATPIPGATGRIVIWGTLKASQITPLLDALNVAANKTLVISYVGKNAGTFNAELTEAIASGSGPDLIILSDDNIMQLSKLLCSLIPASASHAPV